MTSAKSHTGKPKSAGNRTGTKIAARTLQELIDLPSTANEATIRTRILAFFDARGIKWEIERQVGSGSADIYLMDQHCIIEVKTRQKLREGPQHSTGLSKGETPFDQLCRYVKKELEKPRLDGNELPWRGFVTSGNQWWGWVWPRHDEVPKPMSGWKAQTLNADSARDLVHRINEDTGGRPYAPDNPAYLFTGIHEMLCGHYSNQISLDDTKTKKDLWLDQLKASGNHPANADADDLFVTHTLLILISRLISGIPRTSDRFLRGFVGWVDDDEILNDLNEIIGGYNWGIDEDADGVDVLRSLYMSLIKVEHRRAYGEYYTPDWMAEKICRDVISDDFIKSQIDNYKKKKPLNRILDPACGSGTFLYHAAKVVISSKAIKDSHLNDDDVTEFVSKLILGIDIHPVAVEMAVANMSRVVGRKHVQDIRIYQGDSIRSSDMEDRVFADSNNMRVESRTMKSLFFPIKFLQNADNIRVFVESARTGKKMPEWLYHELSKDQIETLKTTYEKMKNVVKVEGNGVWAWYVRNQAAPILVQKGPPVGCIVANPPWVRYNEIQDEKRKKVIHTLAAASEKLWVGGKMATNFELASLFVTRCIRLYMHGFANGRTGWVLPNAAMIGGGEWDEVRKRIRDATTLDMIDFGTLPFPKNAQSAVLFTGLDGTKNYKAVVKKGFTRPDSHDSWNTASKLLDFVKIKKFPKKQSEWVKYTQTSKKPEVLARNGATLFPSVLMCVDNNSVEKNRKNSRFKTKKSRHGTWKNIKPISGLVPSSWIKDCLFGDDLVAFFFPTVTKCVIPINKNGIWIYTRMTNLFWKKVCQYYVEKRSVKSPKSLENNLDFNGKLKSQFKLKTSTMVGYNESGNRIYGAIIPQGSIIEHSMYRLPCKTLNEAYFVIGVLNADSMQEAFAAAKESKRHYDTHIWKKIPIPRYDQSNKTHREIVKISKEAENLIKTASKNAKAPMSRRESLKLLQSRNADSKAASTLMSKLDSCIARILKKYASS